jgi:predicted enzyme related to lactoylglutathione lyase
MRPKPSAVIFAKDVGNLARFYEAVAGLSAIHTADDHVVLDEERFQVVIHNVPAAVAASIQIAKPPSVRELNPIKLCLPVDSIDAARQRALQLGGWIGPKSKEWQARGFRACDGHDPEGNVFQLREAAD